MSEYMRGYQTGYKEQLEGGGTARALAEAEAQETVDRLEGYPDQLAADYWLGYYHGRYHARTGHAPPGEMYRTRVN